MDNQTAKVEITKVSSPIASPGAAITFIFSVYSILSWASTSTSMFGEGASFSIGVVQSLLAIGFLCCAVVNMARGSAFGSVGMVFATVFGLFGGVNQLLTPLMARAGVAMEPKVTAIAFLMAGLFVVGILPTLVRIPFYNFMTNASAAVGLIVTGLAILCGWGAGAFSFAGWCFFITGTTGMYNSVSEVCGDCGVRLPQGPALVK